MDRLISRCKVRQCSQMRPRVCVREKRRSCCYPVFTFSYSYFWGAFSTSILFSEIVFCVASCVYIYICIYISVNMAAPWGLLTLLSLEIRKGRLWLMHISVHVVAVYQAMTYHYMQLDPLFMQPFYRSDWWVGVIPIHTFLMMMCYVHMWGRGNLPWFGVAYIEGKLSLHSTVPQSDGAVHVHFHICSWNCRVRVSKKWQLGAWASMLFTVYPGTYYI